MKVRISRIAATGRVMLSISDEHSMDDALFEMSEEEARTLGRDLLLAAPPRAPTVSDLLRMGRERAEP